MLIDTKNNHVALIYIVPGYYLLGPSIVPLIEAQKFGYKSYTSRTYTISGV